MFILTKNNSYEIAKCYLYTGTFNAIQQIQNILYFCWADPV